MKHEVQNSQGTYDKINLSSERAQLFLVLISEKNSSSNCPKEDYKSYSRNILVHLFIRLAII